MAFYDGILNFKDNLVDAWHDSAQPGQPGYIAPPAEQINSAGVTVGDGTTQMTAPTVFDYPAETSIPEMFRPQPSLPYNSDLPVANPTVYGPQNFNSGLDPFNQPSNYYTPSVFDPTVQIDPAGVTSDDGMMTEPAMYLYPGEEIGIDGVPYRPDAGQTNPAYSYEPNQGGGSVAAYTPSVPEVMLSQDLSQRAPSGTMYAPDLSAYNDSSLFNYTGPGGVEGYTYGQGLRTDGADYSIFGTPTDVANPYYEGQFAPMAQPQPAGPADSAINMSPVQLPDNIPSTNQVINNNILNAFPTIGGGSGTTTATVFPSPEGSNPSLFDRQLAEMTPEQIAYINATLADQNRMQQGQIGSMPYAPAMDDTADVELGMQGPAPVPPRPTVQQYTDMARKMAEQMAINITPEELRDGLFIQPEFEIDENGKLSGKMVIPDEFLQDKTPIPSEYSLFMDEAQFDPDDMFVEPSPEELPLWVGNDGYYYPIYDDMGLGEPFIPTDNLEPASDPLVQIYDDIAKFQNKTRAEEQYKDVITETADFMEARDALIKEQVNEARAEIQDAARRPVYTPKPAPTYDIGRRYGL